MENEFVKIDGFQNYMVNKKGEVINKKLQIKKPYPTPCGYSWVFLYKDKKYHRAAKELNLTKDMVCRSCKSGCVVKGYTFELIKR